jgi:hypothetical protein
METRFCGCGRYRSRQKPSAGRAVCPLHRSTAETILKNCSSVNRSPTPGNARAAPGASCRACRWAARTRVYGSLFDRLPSSGSDPEVNNLDRPGASDHGLAFCSSKSGANEVGDHVAGEAIGALKQCLGSAIGAMTTTRYQPPCRDVMGRCRFRRDSSKVG